MTAGAKVRQRLGDPLLFGSVGGRFGVSMPKSQLDLWTFIGRCWTAGGQRSGLCVLGNGSSQEVA